MEDYEQFGRSKEASAVKNVEVVLSLIMCDKRRSMLDISRQ